MILSWKKINLKLVKYNKRSVYIRSTISAYMHVRMDACVFNTKLLIQLRIFAQFLVMVQQETSHLNSVSLTIIFREISIKRDSTLQNFLFNHPPKPHLVCLISEKETILRLASTREAGEGVCFTAFVITGFFLSVLHIVVHKTNDTYAF